MSNGPSTSWNAPIQAGPLSWRWGPRELQVDIGETEVRVRSISHEDSNDPEQWVSRTLDALEEPVSRFGWSNGREVLLGARAADRPFVVRPALDLTVLGDSTSAIYVSTPVWITLTADGDSAPFFETPVQRPRNTWFGETPQAGELAYASRTRARSQRSQLDIRPGRAVTALTLTNRTPEPWPIARLKIPMPYLALFETPTGLWTPAVEITRTSNDDATIELGEHPPDEAGKSQRIAPARETGTPQLLLRALSSLGLS